jgi:hypothetical protein
MVAVSEVSRLRLNSTRRVICFAIPKIENRVAGSNDRGIVAVKAIVIDCAHPKRSAPAVPDGQCESRVCDEVRSTIHVNAMLTTFEKGIRDFG